MQKEIIFMYSGQGSQYFQMGAELYQNHSRFRLWMDYCDELVSDRGFGSLVKILYGDSNKQKPFDTLSQSNPAIIALEFSLTQVVLEAGIRPSCVLGYSLGELSAAVIGGALTIGEALNLACDYADLLEQKTEPAGMLAVVAPFQIVEDKPELFERLWVSGRNFSNNFVVSGPVKMVDNLQMSLQSQNITAARLPVKYGFHTPMVDGVFDAFSQFDQYLNFQTMTTPLFSVKESKLKNQIDLQYLWRVFREPVYFEEGIRNLLYSGSYYLVDLGPGATIATFTKYILNTSHKHTLLSSITPFGNDLNNLNKLISTFKQEKISI